MTPEDSWRAYPSLRRSVPWAGAALIAAIVGFAALDIWRSHDETIAQTGRELDAQATTIAEQTARSLQAVDVVLRHIAEKHRNGELDAADPRRLQEELHDQALGLVQVDSLVLVDAQGTTVASSLGALPQQRPNIAEFDLFQRLRAEREPAMRFAAVRRSLVDGRYFLPIARRLETRSGAFAGSVGARGKVEYFQQFYADISKTVGTRTALVHRGGTLVARHPAADSALGNPIEGIDRLVAAYEASGRIALRTSSPIDHSDSFGVMRAVPDYPFLVVVSRDADAVLGAWRSHSLGSALRTLLLAVLAASLLWVLMRQVGRLESTRVSLEHARERFALAVSGSDVGLWDWNRSSGTMFASARAREILGLPPGPDTQPADSFFGTVVCHPDDEDRRWKSLDAHLIGRTPAYEEEFRVRQPDGSWRWARVRGVCVRDAEQWPERMAGSVSDVDARRRADEARRESEERYQLAAAGSNEGLWDWNLRTDALFLSERGQRMLGFEAGEPVRSRREWMPPERLHPDDVRATRDALSAHLNGDVPHFACEFRMRHVSGDWHWYRQRGVVVRDADGRPTRMAGSIEDITDHRRAETERERLEAQLRQAQKLEAIGTLAGGIAHDFNNILAAILGYGELAQHEAPVGSPLQRDVDAAMAAAARAKSLVERILAFSRSGVGERVPVHVQSVVAEAVDAVQASLPPGVRLERTLDAGDTAVIGDATQIHQVVMNLCANAVQAMRIDGAVRVRANVIETATPIAATSGALAPGRYLRLEVEDEGVGIPSKVLERIFDPFFTTREVGVGTCLGLSLVHGIVTDLGGGIDVRSVVGRGTTMTVYLPHAGSTPPPTDVPDPAPCGQGETVLIVDDEEALVRLAEEMLAGLGYEPIGFTSSLAALASARLTPDRFQLVVTDEAMPEMAGTELARALPVLRPGLPVLLVSGYVTPALIARARDAGVLEVLAKPLARTELARGLAIARAVRAGQAA